MFSCLACNRPTRDVAAEQGLVVGADLTSELERGYFPSYNVSTELTAYLCQFTETVALTSCLLKNWQIPYFKQIFELSGYPAMVERRGPDYSYDLAPRAKIFRREQSKVQDLEGIKVCSRSAQRSCHFRTAPTENPAVQPVSNRSFQRRQPWCAVVATVCFCIQFVDAGNAICSRGDLRTTPSLGGCYDSKCARFTTTP